MIVSVNDVKTYMDIRLTPKQEDAAELIIAGLQGEMEAYLNRPVEPQEFVEEHVLPITHTALPMASFLSVKNNTYSDAFYETNSIDYTTWASPPPSIYLRNTPIISVSEVRVKPILGTEKVLVVEQDYMVQRYGIDYFYGYAHDTVTVTYEAGLDGANIPLLRINLIRAAAREMQNMHDDVVGVKDLNTRNVGPLITGYLDTELAAMRRYKRRQI